MSESSKKENTEPNLTSNPDLIEAPKPSYFNSCPDYFYWNYNLSTLSFQECIVVIPVLCGNGQRIFPNSILGIKDQLVNQRSVHHRIVEKTYIEFPEILKISMYGLGTLQ